MKSPVGRETTIDQTFILVEEHSARCSYPTSLSQYFSHFLECPYRSPGDCVKMHALIQ